MTQLDKEQKDCFHVFNTYLFQELKQKGPEYCVKWTKVQENIFEGHNEGVT